MKFQVAILVAMFAMPIFAQRSQLPTCQIGVARQCFDSLALSLGLPNLPATIDIPADFATFMSRVQRLISTKGPSGLAELCGYAFDFFQCMGPQIASCTDPRFMIKNFGFTASNAVTYRAYHSQVSQECAAILQGLPRFNCRGKALSSFHLQTDMPCADTFYICDRAGLPFKGVCPSSETIDTTTGTCRPFNFVTRCQSLQKQPTIPSKLRTFSCPYSDGLFANPEMLCSMVFYSCKRSQSTLNFCPENTYFDNFDSRCKSMDKVSSCVGFIPQPKPTPRPKPAPKPVVIRPKPVIVPNPVVIQETSPIRPMQMECDLNSPRSIQCFDTFAQAIGLPSKPGLDLPSDSFQFLRFIDNKLITEGRSGLSQICRAVNEFIQCVPEVGVTCFSDSNLLSMFPTATTSDIAAYKVFFSRFAFECQAVMGEREPFSCTGKDDGVYLPKSRPCASKFLICFQEILLRGNCPTGFTINPEVSLQCQRISQVPRCSGRRPKPEPVPEMSMPSVTCPSQQTRSFKNPLNACSMIFIRCSNGVPSIGRCPDQYFFDESSASCKDAEWISACGGAPRPVVVLPPDNTNPSEVDCTRQIDGNVADPSTKCSAKFYSCVAGKTMNRVCGEATRYDITADMCDFPEFVPACGGTRPVPKKPEPKPIVPKVDFDCTARKSGHYKDPKAPCSYHYFSCVGTTAFENFCATNEQRFSEVLQLCDIPVHVPECGGEERKPFINEPQPTPKPVDFDCTGKSDGFFQDPWEPCSNRFYSCVGSVAREMFCPGKNVYEPSFKFCCAAKHAPVCGGTPPSNEPTTLAPFSSTTPFPHPSFKCPGLGNFADPSNRCSRFYVACLGGTTPLMQECQEGLYYDTDDESCKAFMNVRACNTAAPRPKLPLVNVKIDGTGVSPGKIDRFFSCPARFGTFARSNERCQKEFIQCVQGQAFIAKCPLTQSYDVAQKLCRPDNEQYC